MHFGTNFKWPTVRKATLCLFPPTSFLCFDNKDSLSHPITSWLFPAFSLAVPTCITTVCYRKGPLRHFDCIAIKLYFLLRWNCDILVLHQPLSRLTVIVRVVLQCKCVHTVLQKDKSFNPVGLKKRKGKKKRFKHKLHHFSKVQNWLLSRRTFRSTEGKNPH